MLDFTISTMVVCMLASFAGATEATTKPATEDLIRKGIIAFRDGMMSEDEAVRQKAFDQFMPKQSDFQAIFGDDSGLVWNLIEKQLKFMRENTDKFKEEFDRKGKIQEVELINEREHDISKRYVELIKAIPKDIPLYRAVIKYEKGTGGSSTYVVIQGRAMHISGLESMHKEIIKRKKQ